MVLPLQTHVARLFDLVMEEREPGDVIECTDMLELYETLCERDCLTPRKWNPIARDLKLLMGRGPRGGRKTYQKLLRADGSEEQRRVWIVPQRSAANIEPPARVERLAA